MMREAPELESLEEDRRFPDSLQLLKLSEFREILKMLVETLGEMLSEQLGEQLATQLGEELPEELGAQTQPAVEQMQQELLQQAMEQPEVEKLHR